MTPPVLMIDLGDLVCLVCALLLFGALGLYVLAAKVSESLEQRRTRQ